MASAFGHAFIIYPIVKSFPKKVNSRKILFAGVICAVLPDIDVISFYFGIPYEHMFGHRGFTHSLLFALLCGLIFTFLLYKKSNGIKRSILIWLSLFLSTASHGLLDALTNGGLGVAFFSPWSETRYFFPWTPIEVSPIGASNFLSLRGWQVIKSEALWIGIPGLIYLFTLKTIRRFSRKQNMQA